MPHPAPTNKNHPATVSCLSSAYQSGTECSNLRIISLPLEKFQRQRCSPGSLEPSGSIENYSEDQPDEQHDQDQDQNAFRA